MPIELTSLSSRTEDIPLLIEYFKEKLSEINGVQQPKIDIKNDNLYTYNWPGNVRELENVLQRAIVLSDDKIIDESHIMVDVSCNNNLYKNFDEKISQAAL